MTIRSHVTSHVLDSVTGLPAAGMTASLEMSQNGGWVAIANGVTDADGRLTSFGPSVLTAGTYRVSFDTGSYFSRGGQPTFYPEVTISFTLADTSAHYHVPLLLSPFAYSTYRGS
jgi:5-hydroxyisourate hydrolase